MTLGLHRIGSILSQHRRTCGPASHNPPNRNSRPSASGYNGLGLGPSARAALRLHMSDLGVCMTDASSASSPWGAETACCTDSREEHSTRGEVERQSDVISEAVRASKRPSKL